MNEGRYADREEELAAGEHSECPGHPCEDAADLHPHAAIGEIFYCDGSCRNVEAAR